MARTIINASEQVYGTPLGSGTTIGNIVVGANSGAILYVDNSGTLAQSPLSFSWGATNSRLGIGTNSPLSLVHVKTSPSSSNQSFLISEKVSLSTGVSLSATNDGNTAFVGLEIRGNPTMFSQGNTGFNTTSPLNTVDINGGVAIGAYAGVNTAPTNGLIVSGAIGVKTASVTQGTLLDVAGAITANGLTLRSLAGIQFNDSGTHWVGFQAPTTVTSNTIWNLPVEDGSAGQILKTDGNKNLSFVSGAGSAVIGGVVSGGQVGSVLFIDSSGVLNQDNPFFYYDGAAHKLGAGTSTPTARITSLVGTTGNMIGLLVTQGDTTGNSNAVRIVSSNTSPALFVSPQGNIPAGGINGAITLDNTTNTGVGLKLYSNQASPASTSANLLRIHTANANWNAPVVVIKSDSALTSAPALLLDSKLSAVDWADQGQAAPAGKFRVLSQLDLLQIQTRRADDSTYDSFIVIDRIDTGGSSAGGHVGIATGGSPATSTLQVNGSFATAVTSVTTPYTATKNNQHILVDALSSPNGLTITLGFASSMPGRIYHITKTDSSNNFVGIAPSGTDTVLNKSGYQIFSRGQSIGISSNGVSNWQSVGPISYVPPFIGKSVGEGYVSSVGVTNTAWLLAAEVNQPVSVQGVRLKVTSSSGNVDVGIYDCNGVRVASSGSTSCPSVGKATILFGNPAVLTTPGIYYLAIAADNIAALFSASTSDTIIGANSFTSSFPLPSALVLPGTAGDSAFTLAGIVNGGLNQ